MTGIARLDKKELQKIRKVLVIQIGPFGDALLSTSYFESLKKALPHCELHYLLKEPYHKMVIRHPFLDRLLIIPAGSGLNNFFQRLGILLKIRRERYDLVIDQKNKPSSKYFTWLSGARYKLGYSGSRMEWIYNLTARRDPHRYTASRRFDILRPLGLEEEPYRLYFPVPAEDQRFVDQWLEEQGLESKQTVVISPGSRQTRKKWLTGSYARVADMIQQRLGKRVVLLWAPDEREDVERMAELMKTKALVAPPTSIEQAAALLQRCSLLLCNDSGLNHLAVATETRTLALFGNTKPVNWSPAGAFPTHHHLYIPGRKSRDNDFGLTPEHVFETVCGLLRETNPEKQGLSA